MPNVTFPCPFCTKKMAVGADMLGKKVRCPSCKQVVLAPADGGAPPPPPAPAAAPQAAAPSAPQLDDLPAFSFERKESAESILSAPEESEDEIFGSAAGPQLPRADFGAGTAPASASPFGFDDASPTPRPAEVKKPAPEPPRVAVVMEASPPAAADEDPLNPFSNFDAPVAPAAPPPPLAATRPAPPQTVAAVEDAPPPAPPRATPPAAKPAAKRAARPASTAAAGKTGLGAPFYLLLLYAVIMTGLVVYGFAFRYGTQIDPGHPLSAIPDNFGEFPASERRKQGQLKNLPDAPLPPELRVALGKKLEVGPLEIVPTQVEVRRLEVVTVANSGRSHRTTRSQAVVLTLRIRNASSDVVLHPMDPAFARKFAGMTDEPKPGTTLEVGEKKYRGGAFSWPRTSESSPREFELAQQDDGTPLLPGQTRDYVVFTDMDARIVKAVTTASEPMLWRVQVRRGFVELRGKEVPVTAIFGVEFRSSDVQENGG